MIVFIPLFLITVMVILPTVSLNKKSESEETEMEKHVVVYDTVKVKKTIYDTVRSKKKVVKKKEEVNIEVKSDSITSD
jgi:hypothetical protein